MTRFNKLTKITPNTVTYEGAPAFKYADPRVELVSSVATTFLDNKFYEKSSERIWRVRQLINSTLAMGDYNFLWNLTYIVRRDWNLRSISHILTAILVDCQQRKDYPIDPEFIADIWVRPDDMAETVAFWVMLNGGLNTKQGGRQGMPYLLRKAIEIRFRRLNLFQATKYSGRGTKYSLRNLIRIVRPKPSTFEESELFGKIVRDELPYTDENWRSSLQKIISKGKSTKQAMEFVIQKMGLFAIIGNLNAFDNHQVDENLVINRIINKDAVLRSKLLPFRLVNAIEMVSNKRYQKALLTALEYSFDNLKLPSGNYLIAVDTSGSMQGRPVTQAAMFGAVLAKKAELSQENVVTVVAFSTEIKEVSTFDQGIFSLMQSIKICDVGYGTNGYLVYEFAEKAKIKYDYVIFLTDMQFHNLSADNFVGKEVRDTRITVVFNLGGYSKTIVPFDSRTRLVEIPGFSEKIFDYLEIIKRQDGIVNMIQEYQIKP